MKKILIVLLLSLFVLSALAGCAEQPTETEGSAKEEVTTGFECEEHIYGEGVVTKAPTCTTPGVMTYTCSVCNRTRVEEIPANGDHSYGIVLTEVEATCTSEGKALYKCVECGVEKTDTVPALGHTFEEWTVITEPTYNEVGIERTKCKVCGEEEEREIEKLVSTYNINIDMGDGTVVDFGVGEDGKYSINIPTRIGYNFICLKDADGNEFPAEGTVSENVQIRVVWEIDGTDTLAELIERAAAGVDKIKITADIVVTEPVFFVGATHIYSDGDHVIKRSPEYAGDIFVIGQDKNGISSAVLNKETKLTLGGGEGTLCVDGNSDATTVTVLGSSLFVTDSSIVNIYDGIVISNNKKLGNERSFTCSGFVGETGMARVGGAAIALMNGVVNMYGGVIENNSVVTEYTIEVAEDGTETWLENAGCGGAIYNRGNFNMYGGVIRNNEALRGGGIYNDEIVLLVAGTISENTSFSYGGAVSSSSAAEAQMFIGSDNKDSGTMKFAGNLSHKAGGALYSSTNSPIVILGNAEFTNNKTQSSGGAIYTAGALTVIDAIFTGNESAYSGGAVYHHYSNPDVTRRQLKLEGCVFEGNKASLGGAVILSASDLCVEKGTYATITNCSFKNNSAVQSETQAGNGGAVYITRKSEAKIDGCEFVGNTASTNAGAIAIHSEAKVKLTNLTFNGNTAAFGGAIYTSSQSTLTLNTVKFNGNKAILKESGSGGNGGAIFAQRVDISFNNVEFIGNSADNNAGALYQGGIAVTVDETVSFKENSAKNHGGAVYITYLTNEDETRTGGQLTATGVKFENNQALAGGAISARSESSVTLTNVKFDKNSTPDAKMGTGDGGGAIYANNTTLKLTDVVMDGNLSGYYGGAIRADSCNVELKKVQILNSVGGTGGAVYAGGGELLADGIILKDNESSLNGVVYLTRLKASIKNLEASGNVAVSGGAIYTSSNAEVSVESSRFVSNSANRGGALCVAGESNLSIKNTSFEGNSTKTGNGGAIAVSGAGLKLANEVKFNKNVAVNNGGAIHVSDHTPDPVVNEDGSTTQPDTVKSTVEIKGVSFEGNSAKNGGAVYASGISTISFDGAEFSDNKAIAVAEGDGGNGGAIYTNSAALAVKNARFNKNIADNNAGAIYFCAVTLELDSTVSFTSNEAKNHGGALYAVYSKNADETRNGAILKADGVKFEGNTALSGGAISARSESVVELTNVKFNNNTAPEAKVGTGDGGGAIYANNSTLKLTGVVMDGNLSGYYGGAVKSDHCTVELKNTQIKNSQGGTGGAIYATGGKLTATELTLSGNKSDLNGVIYLTGCEAEFTKLIASANEAVSGGVLYVSNNANVGIVDSELTKNTAGRGGAVCVSKAIVRLNNSKLSENTATSTGGAVSLVNNSELEINNTTFTGNVATNKNGGAIIVEGSKLTLNKDTVFENNTSGYYGGALSVNDYIPEAEGETQPEAIKSTVVISGVDFNNNNALRGGAIYIAKNTYTVTNTKFVGNKAIDKEYGGGAIYSTESSGTLGGVTFTDNTSNKGGAVALHSSSSMTVTSMTATGNAATLNEESKFGLGGVFYVNNSTLTLAEGENESIVIGGETETLANMAERGGAIYAENKATVNVDQVSFVGNSATYGGAVCVTGSEAAVDNCTFNGNAAIYGGAVYASTKAKLTANGADFKCNAATYGGAIYASTGAELSVSGAEFVENTAVADSEGKDGNGGAINVKQSTLTINNTSFLNNKADNNAGAVYVVGCTVEIDSAVSFSGNEAKNHGGAVYLTYVTNDDKTKTGGVLKADGVLFENNSAFAGGAISIRTDCRVELVNSTLNNNSATGTGDEIDGDADGGGAVYVGIGSLKLDNVTMTENKATGGFGGAISAYDATVEINGGSYTLNSAATGGVISVVAGSEVTVTGALFSENKSDFVQTGAYDNGKGGGAIAAFESVVTLSGVTLEKNATEYYGGAILASNSTVTVKDESVISENAGGTGAALYFKNSCTATIENTTITKNTASVNGVIYANRSTVSVSGVSATENSASSGGVFYVSAGAELTVSDSELNNNFAKSGGVIYLDAATVTVNNSSLNYNGLVTDSFTGANLGGAILARKGTLQLSGVEFIGNAAGQNGGAICIQGSEVTVQDQCSFKENTAVNHAGAIYVSYYEDAATETTEYKLWKGILNLTGGTFSSNTAMGGGAISIRSSCEAYITDTVFTNNSVSGYADNNDGDGEGGGAIYVGYGKLELNNVTMTGNESEYFGGAVNVLGSKNTSVVGGEFTENTANYGGVFYFHNSTVTVTGGNFSKNTAVSGGMMRALNSDVSITGTVISENEATSDDKYEGGGAIYAEGGNLTVSGATLDKNKSEYYGGAINAQKGTVIIKDNTVISNSIGSTGAALYFREDGTNVTITGSTVSNTESNGNGVIYITQTGTLTIDGLIATGNHASTGGVLYASGPAVITINNSTFTSNTSNIGGGAIDHRATGTLTVTNSTFTSNTAKVAGGAILANGTGLVEIIDCTFEGNQALATANANSSVSKISRGGGAIFVTSNANVSISGNCSFTGNSAAGVGNATSMTDAGGAILVDGGTLTVDGADFTMNVGFNGGAIGTSSNTATAMNINNCTFDGNNASKNGGAIYIQNAIKNETDTIFVNNCTFENNAITTGDGSGSSIYIRTNSSATITNVTSSGGTNSYGGAFYVTGGARVTLGGTVSLSGDKVYVTGAATTAIVNYKTDEEKTAWENAITTASNATVTYVAN